MDFAGLFSEHLMREKLHTINLSFQVDTLSIQFGGCAGNIAYSLALLGEKAQIVATAGSDFGQYRAHMMRSGVDPSGVRILDTDLTSSAYILTDKADNQIAAFHGGAGNNAYDIPVDTEGRAFAIVSPGCAHDMRDLPGYYRKHGVKYMYDPGQQIPALTRETIEDGITGAFALFASDYEYALIQKKTSWAQEDLLERVPTIIVTYAGKGSDLITKEGVTHIDAVPAQAIVDPTGSGDAYRAGFIKGLVLGLPLLTCARLGSTAAVYVVETYGTQTHHYTLEDIAHRYKKTYGETLAL